MADLGDNSSMVSSVSSLTVFLTLFCFPFGFGLDAISVFFRCLIFVVWILVTVEELIPVCSKSKSRIVGDFETTTFGDSGTFCIFLLNFLESFLVSDFTLVVRVEKAKNGDGFLRT